MTFASWWAEKYRTVGEVPEQFFNMMRDAYERGEANGIEACAKVCDEHAEAERNSQDERYMARTLADELRVRSNVLADRPAAPLAAGPESEANEVERRVGPQTKGQE